MLCTVLVLISTRPNFLALIWVNVQKHEVVKEMSAKKTATTALLLQQYYFLMKTCIKNQFLKLF